MRKEEEKSEQTLIERLKNQEERALEELVEVYESDIFRIVRQVVKGLLPEEDVQEIVNDTFYQVWRHAANLDSGKGSVRAYLNERRINRPVITVDGKEPEIYSIDEMTEAMSEEDQETGKEYYLFTLEGCQGAGAVYFGEGLKTVDVEYDTGWLEEHKADVVSLNFNLENVMSESLVLEPGEISEGIIYDKIVIGHFSVSGEGSRTNEVRMEIVMPVPTITAVYKDGSETVLQPGNMGGDPHAFTAASGGTITSMEPEGEGIKFQSVLTSYVDIKAIKEIRINEDVYVAEQ